MVGGGEEETSDCPSEGLPGSIVWGRLELPYFIDFLPLRGGQTLTENTSFSEQRAGAVMIYVYLAHCRTRFMSSWNLRISVLIPRMPEKLDRYSPAPPGRQPEMMGDLKFSKQSNRFPPWILVWVGIGWQGDAKGCWCAKEAKAMGSTVRIQPDIMVDAKLTAKIGRSFFFVEKLSNMSLFLSLDFAPHQPASHKLYYLYD